MSGPNRVQKRVLRAITDQAVAASKLRSSANGALDGPSRAASRREVESFDRERRELESAAVAGGVPPEWIEQTRQRGELGMVWRPDIFWREPEPVDRAQLVADLGSDAWQVLDIAAVAAAYGEWGARAEPGAAKWFGIGMKAQGRRLAAVAAVLEVTESEAETLWGGPVRLAAADRVRGDGDAELRSRWRSYAAMDTGQAAIQATALERAGVKVGSAANPPPSVAEMQQEFGQLLSARTDAKAPRDPDREVAFTQARHSPSGGARVTALIGAAGLSDLRPVFSAADPPQPPPTATPSTENQAEP